MMNFRLNNILDKDSYYWFWLSFHIAVQINLLS